MYVLVTGVRCELCDVQTLTEWLALTRRRADSLGLGSIPGTVATCQDWPPQHWTLVSCYKPMSHRQQFENIS